jgi:flagellar biosynthesis protein FlhG
MHDEHDALPPESEWDTIPPGVEYGARFLAVGGGRGGVGKSLVAVNLAVYFAQLGKTVVLVDADAGGANLHAHFGLKAAWTEPDATTARAEGMQHALVPTSIPGLSLLPAPHDALAPSLPLRRGKRSRWLSAVHQLAADYVVVDAGPGHGDLALDLMLTADVAIAVTIPEPPAIEATYRFVRAAFRRRLWRAFRHDPQHAATLEHALASLGPLPAPIQLVHRLAKLDAPLADAAWSHAQSLRLQLVVNQIRARGDSDLGSWMSGLVSRHYGVALDELGHIEQDDTVWLTVRRNKPLLVDSPTTKAARNLERIARRVLALATTKPSDRTTPVPAPIEDPTLYAVLGVGRAATDEETRRAYKRQREVYATGGLATFSILDADQLAGAQRKLEEAHDTLLDAVRRRAYDLSTFAEPTPDGPLSARSTSPALAAEQLLLQRELQREIGPDTEFTGPLLRKVRESLGLELADIAAKTKIARPHLEAIEEEKFEDLPALVYTRGFLGELAKQLRLDPMHVQKSYLRRMREDFTSRGKELV